MKQTAVNLLVALPAEAKPLIAHFGLKRQQPDGDFPLYRAEAVTLVRSGVGRDAAAAATRFLAEQTSCKHAVWMNIGIAGHGSRAIGEPVLARRIIDQQTNRAWTVDFSFTPPCETEDLMSLDQPEFDYRGQEAFDIEAAGIMDTLTRVAPGAQLYCLKVISDNRDNPAQGISGPMVTRLISNQTGTISKLLELLASTPSTHATTHQREAS